MTEARLCPSSSSNPVCTSLLSHLGSSLPTLRSASESGSRDIHYRVMLMAFKEPFPP